MAPTYAVPGLLRFIINLSLKSVFSLLKYWSPRYQIFAVGSFFDGSVQNEPEQTRYHNKN